MLKAMLYQQAKVDIPKMERIGDIECDDTVCLSTSFGVLKTSIFIYDFASVFYSGVIEAITTFDVYLDDELVYSVDNFLNSEYGIYQLDLSNQRAMI